MQPKVLIPLVGSLILLSVGTAWGVGTNLDTIAFNLAPVVPGFRPDPKDIAFYYPLPQVVPMTSPFGWRVHPIYGTRRFHAGLDLGAPHGMPVLAAHAGWVRYAGWKGGYGNAVVIEYADGQYQTLYAHLSAILIKVGEPVRPRQVIGRVGSTGGSTGPHLHFELQRRTAEGWLAVNPYHQVNAVEPYVAVRPAISAPSAADAPPPASGAALDTDEHPPEKITPARPAKSIALDFAPPN